MDCNGASACDLASPVFFYGISAQLKTLEDRLHTPKRNRFPIRRLGLILAGAATLPDLFDPILLQYRMICRFFYKTFTRFHGVSPSSVRKDEVLLKTFAPLKLKISLEGGYLDYKIIKKDAFTVIANAKTFSRRGSIFRSDYDPYCFIWALTASKVLSLI